jgi:hypothetical protein
MNKQNDYEQPPPQCLLLWKVLEILLGTKYFGRHSSVTSKQINVNQALTSSQ